MERLRKLTATIGLEELINCTLVKEGQRNAFLIQPADYNETYSTDPKTAQKLNAIKAEFPELIQSNIHSETLISKKRYSNTDIKNNGDMGKILGYPCYDEYNYTLSHPDETKVGIDITVNLKPGYNTESLQILAFVCRTERAYKIAKDMATAFERVLKTDPNLGSIINSVEVHKNIIASPKSLINKLLENTTLTEEEQDEVQNYIWNLGLENASNYRYDLKNPVHRGIVIGLLAFYDNNPIEPFYPLQFRKEQKMVDQKTEKWGQELQRIFSTKAKGGRRTRKSIL